VAIAAVVLLIGGWTDRVAASVAAEEVAAKVKLPQALGTLPLTLGAWRGEELPLSAAVQRVAQYDDFVHRRYRCAETADDVTVYIGYTARPRTMLRHRPGVCYPSAGWSGAGTRTAELPGPGGAALPVLVNRFNKPGGEQRCVVLNYYVLNGALTVDENSFWGLRYRDGNRNRDASRYVAQIQIMVSATIGYDAAERVAERFAAESAAEILALLPGAALGRSVHR
jgi:EpsI family protein